MVDDRSAQDSTEDIPLLEPDDWNSAHDIDSDRKILLLGELRILTRYTLPIFITQVLEYSFEVASVLSIGHHSTSALAAITLAMMTASVSGYSIIYGFTSALDTVLPSAWTSSTPQLVGLWAQRITVLAVLWLIPVFAIWLNSEGLLLLLKQEPEVAHLASVYLKWSCLGVPAFIFNNISRRYFQSQGLFSVPRNIVMVIAPLNAFLNYILVWGPEAIRFGFSGVAIANAFSLNLIAVAYALYGIYFVPKTAWHPISRRSFSELGLLIRLGLAGVGQTAGDWWSWEIVALAASSFGSVSLAAQSVLLVSATTAFQFPSALSVATSVRIGNLLGNENAKRARMAATASMTLGLALSAIWSTLFLIFRESWGRIFNSDPEVLSIVAAILPLVALFQTSDAAESVACGILRARGKQATGALLNFITYYLIGIPLGIWLAFSKNLGLLGLWIGLNVSVISCASCILFSCVKTDWNLEVRKALDRIEAGNKSEETEQSTPV